MKGYFGQKDYSQTIAYAEKVLNAPKIDDRIKSDAHIMIARSAIATDNESLAKTAYEDVKKIFQENDPNRAFLSNNTK